MSNDKKILAEKLKAKLNSSEYVKMPDLISYDDDHCDMLTWIWGGNKNIHKKDNWISGDNINSNGKWNNKYKSEDIVVYDELEPSDWEEIVNLIEKRNREKEEKYKQKKNNIKQKLNNNPNLYYRFSKKRGGFGHFVYPDKHGGYFSIWGVENGQEYFLNININHPVLNNFPWEKNGYYLIETDKKIERNDKFGRPWSDGGVNNPHNFHKWVEIGDEINITFYNVNKTDLVENTAPDNSEKKNFNSNLIWWIGMVVILSAAGIVMTASLAKKKKKS